MAFNTLTRLLFPTLSALLLTGCGGFNFDVYYNSELVRPALPEGQKARVVTSMAPQEALARYKAEGYRIIGSMNFSSERISNKEVAAYAAKKGASLVLACSQRTGSVQKNYLVPVVSSSTTYHSGTISTFAGPTYNLSGTSTTTRTDWQQRSYTVGRYEHLFIFLTK